VNNQNSEDADYMVSKVWNKVDNDVFQTIEDLFSFFLLSNSLLEMH